MADLEKLADDLSALTVLEAAELSKMLEEKWGVSAAAPVAVAAAPGAAAPGEAAAEEKDEFDVVLASFGDKKIAFVNDKTAYGKGLAEATQANYEARGGKPALVEFITEKETEISRG